MLDYELIDCGQGRKLERFGAFLIDRPGPAATDLARRSPGSWDESAARYERAGAGQGKWQTSHEFPASWRLDAGGVQLELKLTESGQVGVFPEQADNWEWLKAQSQSGPTRILNLFGYAGGATLVAAAAGAIVTHVDAAASAVAWARRNAELSGLAGAPIRWIVEDAGRFVQREARRGAVYDGIILDPPSYGHGPRGDAWKLDSDLPDLLAACAKLLTSASSFVLLSCHSPGWPPQRLRQLLTDVLAGFPGACEAQKLILRSRFGVELPSGCVARWRRA